MTFDLMTKAIVRVDETLGYNIFCSGLAKLASGVVFAAGGNLNQALDGINKTTTFDPSTNTWSAGPLMSQARWYPSVTPLANGEMLVTGGGPSLSEVHQANGTFCALTNAQQAIWAKREYQWMIATASGKTTYVGPDDQIGLLDTNGTGAYQSLGARDGKNRNYGSFASFAPGKVLISGGGYFDSSAVVVDVNAGVTTATGSMAHQRRQHNLTVLADGTFLATGGFGNSSQGFVDVANNVYDAEIYTPATGLWRTVAPEERARQHHSTAMLLPDGRVMSAGGGMCGAARCGRLLPAQRRDLHTALPARRRRFSGGPTNDHVSRHEAWLRLLLSRRHSQCMVDCQGVTHPDELGHPFGRYGATMPPTVIQRECGRSPGRPARRRQRRSSGVVPAVPYRQQRGSVGRNEGSNWFLPASTDHHHHHDHDLNYLHHFNDGNGGGGGGQRRRRLKQHDAQRLAQLVVGPRQPLRAGRSVGYRHRVRAGLVARSLPAFRRSTGGCHRSRPLGERAGWEPVDPNHHEPEQRVGRRTGPHRTRGGLATRPSQRVAHLGNRHVTRRDRAGLERRRPSPRSP